MRFPEPIKKNATIGITAPSFGASTEPYITRFNYAVTEFKKLGYNICIGQTCTKNDGLGISTKPQIAAKELMDFYLDDSIDAIISCGGGELMCETMSFVDFDRLAKAKPKWFMGYSDNTNFIFPMATLCNTAGIYGPTITGFGKPWEQAEKDALALITGTSSSVRGYDMFQNPEADDEAAEKDPLSPYVMTDKKILHSFIAVNSAKTDKNTSEPQNTLYPAPKDFEINMEGILLGGCLDVLANLAGTRLDGMKNFSKSKGIVWVLEDCDGNPMEIRRNIWHLDECGWFKNAKGFIIGRPLSAWNQSFLGVNQYNAVTDILAKYNVPVIMDADIGHISPSMPVIIGSHAKVHAKNNDIQIDFKK